jgi:adenylate cyclase
VAYLLLAVGALRYTLAPLLLTAGVVVATTLALIAAQAAAPGGTSFALAGGPAGGVPLFEPRANLIRLALLALTAAALVLVVRRARARLVEALELGERAVGLQRYLPAPVARLVASEGVGTLGAGEELEASVLFADVVGFTALAERVRPAEVGRLLTGLRRLQREAIEAQGGFVDKFIGDAVMGVFGLPDRDPRAAAHALAAARAMRDALAGWNDARTAAGGAAVGVGIGVHHGRVFAGAVGDEARLEFAVLGDAVNVAQRCERLTRELGEPLLVTRALLDAAGADPARWRTVAVRPLPGRRGEVELLAPV